MFGLTPYENKGYDLFDVFHDFEKNFFDRDLTSYNGLMKNGFRTDIKDEGEKFVLEAELPGFNKEDISVDIDNEMLTISAKHEDKKDEKDKEGKYIRRERSYGCFQRSFNIADIDDQQIDAQYENGVLKLNLPKKTQQAQAARKLEIK